MKLVDIYYGKDVNGLSEVNMMAILSTRRVNNPGIVRRIFTDNALAVAGNSRFAKFANLTVGEIIGRACLARAVRSLPLLKPGYVRYTHKTSIADADKVVKNGLGYIGYLLETAYRFETAAAAAKYLLTCQRPDFGSDRFHYPRERAVVLDLPIAEADRHEQFKEWGDFLVPKEYIVGVIDTSSQSREIHARYPRERIFG